MVHDVLDAKFDPSRPCPCGSGSGDGRWSYVNARGAIYKPRQHTRETTASAADLEGSFVRGTLEQFDLSFVCGLRKLGGLETPVISSLPEGIKKLVRLAAGIFPVSLR
jgi:hypothetical protein